MPERKAKTCEMNLTVLQGALAMYEISHSIPLKKLEMAALIDLGYIKSPLICPDQGEYSIGRHEGNWIPQCSKHGPLKRGGSSSEKIVKSGPMFPRPTDAGVAGQAGEVCNFLGGILRAHGSRVDNAQTFPAVWEWDWIEIPVMMEFLVPENALLQVLEGIRRFHSQEIFPSIRALALAQPGEKDRNSSMVWVRELNLSIFCGPKAPRDFVEFTNTVVVSAMEKFLKRTTFVPWEPLGKGKFSECGKGENPPATWLTSLTINRNFEFEANGNSHILATAEELEREFAILGEYFEVHVSQSASNVNGKVMSDYRFRISGRFPPPK